MSNVRYWQDVAKDIGAVSTANGRVDHQLALGNAVVPQCAEVVGHMIRELARFGPPTKHREIT